MHNMVYLIGRITNELSVVDGKCTLTISSQRAYKNEDGIYEVDMIPCELVGVVAQNTVEYCTKGDLVGIKGSLRADEYGTMAVVVDKITFLASKKAEQQDNEEDSGSEEE